MAPNETSAVAPVAGLLAALRRAVRPFRRRPVAKRLYLEVTHRCNLRCLGCYTGAGQEKPDALSLAEQQSVVRQARAMGARVVSLSGSGEPMMCPHLTDLIDFIRGQDMRGVMFTNGTLVDARAARFLASRDVTVFVQLQSLSPTVADRLAGRDGAYEWVEHAYRFNGAAKTVRLPAGLKALLDCGFPAGRLNLEALITRVNQDSLPDVAALSMELGLGLHLETPVFKARALDNYEQLALSGAEYRRLFDRLVGILGEGYFQAHRAQRCPVERNPVVWTNGDVGFCSSRSAAVGNVREAPLRKLYARARRLKRREDRWIARHWQDSRYFYTCPARQYHQAMRNLPCEY